MIVRVFLVYFLLLPLAAHVQAQQATTPESLTDIWTAVGTAMGAVATGVAALIAAFQYAANNRRQKLVRVSELRHLIETEQVRDARRKLMQKLTENDFVKDNSTWWHDETLHGYASDACAAYDHIGSMLRYFPDEEIKTFFLNRWGETAIRLHALVQSFLDHRRKKAPQTYAGFSWFEDKAAPLHRTIERSEAQRRDGHTRVHLATREGHELVPRDMCGGEHAGPRGEIRSKGDAGADGGFDGSGIAICDPQLIREAPDIRAGAEAESWHARGGSGPHPQNPIAKSEALPPRPFAYRPPEPALLAAPMALPYPFSS